MKIKIKCPKCEKTIKVKIKKKSESSVRITKRVTSNSSWLEIAEKIRIGSSNLEIGDEITFKLTNGDELTVQVAAIDVYGGRTAFVLKDCLDEDRFMNEECTNAGGWAKSDMTKWLNSNAYNLLPDDLKSVIKPREIKQRVGNDTFTLNSRLWLPSHMEVTGNKNNCDIDDVHFPLFADEKSRVKSIDGETYSWWLRSASSTGGFCFCCVYSNGGGSDTGADDAGGVVLGFLI